MRTAHGRQDRLAADERRFTRIRIRGALPRLRGQRSTGVAPIVNPRSFHPGECSPESFRGSGLRLVFILREAPPSS
jgi:hypothetical protein